MGVFVELFVIVVVDVVLGVQIEKLTIVVLFRGETRLELMVKCLETPARPASGEARADLVRW